MDSSIAVALIGFVGTVVVAVLNHRLTGRVRIQEGKVEQLFALSMSEDTFNHLKRLSTNNYGPYWVDDGRQFGLAAEVNYLKMLGYIKLDQDERVPDLRELPAGDNPNLSQYVSVTKEGLDFIALREEALRQARNRRS
ncbi:MAG: hypothetical protein LC799_21130 [Actinobacteria bacterium]|nr:hypothetical protein [Actinomycetota bacterium]